MTTHNPHAGANGSSASAITEALGLAFTNAEIPLDRTFDNPKDHRLDAGGDSQEDAELTESIRARGVLVPIIVWEDARGFPIVDGHRRCRCARRAGLLTISARVMSRQPTEHESAIIALLGNTQRKNILDVAFGMACLALLPTYGTATEISRVVHKSIATVTRAIRLVERLPPDIRAQVKPGGIPATVAAVLCGLHRDPPKQRHFARMYLDKVVTTADQLQAAIKANGKADAAGVAGFTLQEQGVKISVTLPGQDLEIVESVLQQLLKDVRKHKERGLEHFKEFLDRKARAAKKAAELQQAKETLDAHVN